MSITEVAEQHNNQFYEMNARSSQQLRSNLSLDILFVTTEDVSILFLFLCRVVYADDDFSDGNCGGDLDGQSHSTFNANGGGAFDGRFQAIHFPDVYISMIEDFAVLMISLNF
ncbi:hypothetical protein BLOT_010437 [Blomia tropicalis]|nr:hypothetical protein BLOT_010437 [Blomia tropicalis]